MMRTASFIWRRSLRWASPLGVVFLVTSGSRTSASDSTPKVSVGAAKLAQQRNAGVIVNIEHDGLHFKITMNQTGDSLLKILIPERDSAVRSSSRPPVRLRVQLRNGAVIEGAAEPTPPWTGNAGSVDITYSFVLHRVITMDEIFAVRISIRDQRFTVMPW